MTETADDDATELLAGRYRLGAPIAHGAAVVRRAWDTRKERVVAVKILPPGSQPARGGRAELDVIAQLRHPGLVALHDVGVEQDRSFVVMDFMEGGNLADRLRDGALDPAAVMALGAILADALAHVHARGVVHRDVKPGNVLLDRDGRPRLTDFGIARLTDAAPVTTTGTVIGTAAYMAPEQVRGASVGAPADVYALGLLLLEAVTGRREYDGTPLESAVARLHRRPVIPGSLPRPLAAVLRRMTSTEPAARPAAAVVAAVLRGEATLPAVRSERARRTLPLAVASMAAAALAGTLALSGTTATPNQDIFDTGPLAPLSPLGPPPVPQAAPAPPTQSPATDPGVDRAGGHADHDGGDDDDEDVRDGRGDDDEPPREPSRPGDDDAATGPAGSTTQEAPVPAAAPPPVSDAVPATVPDAVPATVPDAVPDAVPATVPDGPLVEPPARQNAGSLLPDLVGELPVPPLVPGLLDGAERVVLPGAALSPIV